MVIFVKSIVDACDTYSQGETLRKEIINSIQKYGDVKVSFVDIRYATSSFVNGAFAGLLLDYDIQQIKDKLSIVGSHRQINDLVRRSLQSGVARYS